jgi:aryl-alcohol dehydrogenase-like predicted oxidoreductase
MILQADGRSNDEIPQTRQHCNECVQPRSWREAFVIIDRFIEAGGNLIDTANVYGGGESERLIGRWFAYRPADVTGRVVLASKARFGTGPDVNEAGLSRRNLDRALTASLRRLGLEETT